MPINFKKSTQIFLSFSLIGPLILLLLTIRDEFIYSYQGITEFLIFIWPSILIISNTNGVEEWIAVMTATLFQLIFFTYLGRLIGLRIEKGKSTAYIEIALYIWVITTAVWLSGFDYEYVNALSVISALALYAIAFILSRTNGVRL